VTDSDPGLPFSGGGIENHGNLTLDHSIVTRNSSLWGGGILNQGTAHIDSSSITSNTSSSGGGGILNGPTFGAGAGSEQLFVTDSTVSGNTAFQGGGIYNKGSVTLAGQARIGGNTAGGAGQGGGIFNDPGATVSGATSDTFTPPNVPDDCVGCASGG
jgi:predicted outer membrane repeat protein